MKRYHFATSLIALFAISAGCGKRHSDPDRAAATVRQVSVVPVARKDIARTTTQPGYVYAFEDAPIYAKIAGYLERLHVDMGDKVRGPRYSTDGKLIEPGQLLLEISVPELADELRQKQAAARQAEAALQQARSQVQVSDTAISAAQAGATSSEASIERAEAVYRRWESEYKRVDELAHDGAVTPKVADETHAQFDASAAGRREATAQLDAARAAIKQAEAQLEKSKADVQGAEAQVQVADADEQRVTTLLEYTKVRAPFDGVISERNTNLGHFVPAGEPAGGKPVFMLVQADVVRVFVDVPELDAALVDVSDRAVVRVEALGDREFQGNVTRMSWTLSNTARTLHTEVDLPNPSGELRPGMYVNVTIVLAERQNAVTLPNEAIVSEAGQAFCWLVANGTAHKTPLKLGLKTASETEVLEGLLGGESVITGGVATLQPDQPVQIATPAKP